MNKHRIDNSSSLSSVEGDLDISGRLGAGAVTVNKNTLAEFTFPITQGAAGQIPMLNSSGQLEWGNANAGISNQIVNEDGTQHVTSVAAGTADNVDVTCDGALSAKFLPDLLTLYGQVASPIFRLNQIDNTASVGIRAPATGVTSWNLTLPTTVPTRADQALTAAVSGTSAWRDTAIHGGNSLTEALDMGTNDAYGVNVRTNGTVRFSIDTSGNLTGTGATWTQNEVPLTFSVSPNTTTNYTTITTTRIDTTKNAQMRVQLWGAGGSYMGGSGAYAEITLDVLAGQTYHVLTGHASTSNAGTTTGGTDGGTSGKGGTGNNGGGGGQYSALFRQNGSLYFLLAAAGGGGGGHGSGFGGGGGFPGTTNTGIPGGYNGGSGLGGAGQSPASNGSAYATAAITTGVSFSTLTNDGNGGSWDSVDGSGGGGGYGGGGGAGANYGAGGGGNYVQNGGTVINGTTVISSSIIPGNTPTAGTPAVAPNESDPNWVSGRGRGGSATIPTSGGDGLAVVTMTPGLSLIETIADVKTNGHMQLTRGDGAQTVSVRAAPTSQSWTMTLPVNQGTENYILRTNGTGTTSWAPISVFVSATAISDVTPTGFDETDAANTSTDYIRLVGSSPGCILLSSTDKYKRITVKSTTGASTNIYSNTGTLIVGITDTIVHTFVATGTETWTEF